ncbi:MAG: tRNA threonylcarbamoyladenosine dehydratase [Bacilli bacterium]|nr:tRNA threonylcarbamoyladenosine dehydratase [Bacilli bacterium]
MIDQFSRLKLLIGEEAIQLLKTKRVAVFGLGGVGGNVCDALARSGIEHFVIVDNDAVSISNINRQLIANLNTIGKLKVDVMEKHLKSINSGIEVEKRNCFYLPETANSFNFSKFDYVIDAIDTVKAKIDIICRCKEANVLVISALGCGNKLDPTQLEISDIKKTSYDPLAKVLRRELKKRNITSLKVVYSKESPIDHKEKSEEDTNKRCVPGSSAFVPPVVGIIIASEVIKDLLSR